MALYKKIRELWNKPTDESAAIWNQRLIDWRTEPVSIRIERPTRLDRARSVGYRAKPGIILVRQRVLRGGRQRPQIRAGRRSRHMRRMKVLSTNYQWVAENRAGKLYSNCEVLNSYYVAQDGKHYWYEVILVDKHHPAILADPTLNWIASPKHNKRVTRGLTSAARKSRGLRRKGKGAEKVRPSKEHHGKH